MKDERYETYTSGNISYLAYRDWEEDIYHPMNNILSTSPEALSISSQTKVRDLYYQYLSLR